MTKAIEVFIHSQFHKLIKSTNIAIHIFLITPDLKHIKSI